MLWRFLNALIALAATALLGALLAATLVWTSPGFGADERQLDPRLSAGTVQALVAGPGRQGGLPHFYATYLRGLARGDWGTSTAFERPVRQLFAERAGATSRLLAVGLLAGWGLALAFGVLAAAWRHAAADAALALASGIWLCVPVAALALLLPSGAAAPLALALVVFAKVFPYVRNALRHALAMPHVVSAWARGLAPARILWRHAFPAALPELIALAGVSVALAFGAAIPIEATCDLPGLGQLAWKAALARDLPVLVDLTILVALLTQCANRLSDAALALAGRSAS